MKNETQTPPSVRKEIELKHQPNSIELHRNAKGEYSWKLKRYYNECAAFAMKRVLELDEDLKSRLNKNDNY